MTTQVASLPPSAASPDRLVRLVASGAVIVTILYLILYGLYALWEPSALTAYTFGSLVNNTAPLAIAAAGETLVILARGFDLSVAGVISLTNVVMASYPVDGPGGALLSLMLCMAVGGIVGAVNGYLVAVLRLQTIAATLGTMIICQGLSLVILDAPGGVVSDFVADTLTDTLFGFVPVSGLIVAAVVGAWLMLRRTDLGVALYTIGTDEAAAALSGVRVARTRFLAFVAAGMVYGIAGFMLTAQTVTGNPNSGSPFLMLTFAAVALGGTSLSGGRGGLVGSIMGAALLMLLQKVLFSGGVSSFYTGIFQGAVLVLAIVFSRALTHLLERSRA
ncbi:ABC transporter permease [Methylobacterium terricola]|uniref:ABC transporter permease n=1 Tax=Methylobacterium terricola TaxID=2583531 RepID=A0A5C4LLW2_9HYPH|nr:ABC transporter permease [Methylobacterium terricola]TNC14955.1 ABC transporter permease [Methylobacterium terricola]